MVTTSTGAQGPGFERVLTQKKLLLVPHFGVIPDVLRGKHVHRLRRVRLGVVPRYAILGGTIVKVGVPRRNERIKLCDYLGASRRVPAMQSV
jgi:hypothetical protein